MDDLKGKVAIITGAGRGTGRGIAIAYGRAGIKVVVTSRTRSTVDKLCDQIRSEGGSAIGFACDVGHRDQVFATIEQAAKECGTIDILVNAAQSFGPSANPSQTFIPIPLEEYDEDHWENTYRTGLLGTLWAMKAAFPYLKRRGGKIINFCSLAGIHGRAYSVAYNCTKEGVRALTRTAAREWGKYNINVNVINPMLASEAQIAWEAADPTEANAVRAVTPMGRFGDVIKDGGGCAIFLASSASDYITGMTFMLDGGFFMYP
jgi:NAD(P)-dependent dehydrogenase (short-subunit alcohol dehydrogenase family)